MIQLTIRFDPQTGAINLSGPLENRLLVYGLLEMAREIVQRRGAPPANGKIIQPEIIVKGLVK